MSRHSQWQYDGSKGCTGCEGCVSPRYGTWTWLRCWIGWWLCEIAGSILPLQPHRNQGTQDLEIEPIDVSELGDMLKRSRKWRGRDDIPDFDTKKACEAHLEGRR